MSNVTIKGGASFDAPWIVVGTDSGDLSDAASQVAGQRAYILAAFGMDPEDPEIKDLSLAEIVAQASVHFQGVWAAAQGLGEGSARASVGGGPKARSGAPKARTTASKKAEAKVTDLPPRDETADVFDGGDAVAETKPEPEAPAAEAAEPEAHEHQAVLDEIPPAFADVLVEIAEATTKRDLQKIFKANPEAMRDNTVLDALKARTGAVA